MNSRGHEFPTEDAQWLTPLADAHDAERHGGKAAGLMLAQGLSYLPVLQNGAMIGLINRRAILRALKEHFGE